MRGLYRGVRHMGKLINKFKSKKIKRPNKFRSKYKAKRTSRKQKRKQRRSNRKSKKRNFHSASVGNPDRASSSHTHGRPLKRAKIIKKLLKSSINNTVFAISNFGAAYRGEGGITIANLQAALTDTNLLECPLHLWELNGSPQGVNTDILVPVIFYKLFFDNSTDTTNVSWRAAITSNTPVDTVTNINTSRLLSGANEQYNLARIEADANTDLNDLRNYGGPGARGYVAGVKFRLLLNSPQQRSTKFVIQLVQLSEEVVPGAAVTTVNTAFWQTMIKPYMFSPLADGLHGDFKKYIKILRSQTVTLDAPESIEDHMTSRTKLLNIFYALNRTCNYRWGQNADKQAMETNDLIKNININNISTHVEPKARIYMMIRAQAEQVGALTNTVVPSYDIVAKFYHKHIGD